MTAYPRDMADPPLSPKGGGHNRIPQAAWSNTPLSLGGGVAAIPVVQPKGSLNIQDARKGLPQQEYGLGRKLGMGQPLGGRDPQGRTKAPREV